ncbi:MAG: GvpL/GvpF family gas vesicle protein [Acidobacteriaceae bacterium]
MSTVLYLYGISPAGTAFANAGVGVDGAAKVLSAQIEDLRAWYSEVDASIFGAGLAERIEDLDWLANASVRHQQTLARIAEHATVIPARFGTVFVSPESLAAHVREHLQPSRATLAKIADAEEWGVKVFRRKTTVATAVTASSGSDYLKQKATLRQGLKHTVAPEVVQFAKDLSACSAAVAPVGKLSSAQPALEWQASFLVKKKQKASWDKILRRYAGEWSETREVECSGPWPPYSFV